MKNNIKNLFLLPLISLSIIGCYSDEGNYTYNDINEVKILDIKESYSILKGVGSLHITPTILSSMEDENSKNYSYRWEINQKVISTEPVLDYVADLDKGNYTLYFRIMDNKTGVEWKTKTLLQISYPFVRGFLVTGEDKEGYMQLDMVAMVSDGDTLLLKDLLSESGLPKLKGVKEVIHTGSHYDASWIKMWVTGDKSYYVDPNTFKSNPATMNFNNLLFTALPIPEDLSVVNVEPKAIKDGMTSSRRIIICNNGWVFKAANTSGDFYGNPINYLSSPSGINCFNTAPYAFFMFSSYSGGLLLYDKDNERFVKSGTFDTNCSVLKDSPTDVSVFPWENKEVGRTLKYGENTMNKDGGSSYGNSFALMTNAENNAFWIYKFYTASGNGTKRDGYEIKTAIATNIDKAQFFAFSSNRTLLLYAVGSKLYAYDYNKNNEKIYELDIKNGSDEITFMKFDLQTKDATFNDLYVGTYNETTGGTLRKVTLNIGDPNTISITTDPKAVWEGLCKIKAIGWRNS